jgi:hypothetical protein
MTRLLTTSSPEIPDEGPSASEPPIKAVRELKGRAPRQDDPYNTILYRRKVRTDDEGVLSGKRVALKDTISNGRSAVIWHKDDRA